MYESYYITVPWDVVKKSTSLLFHIANSCSPRLCVWEKRIKEKKTELYVP